MTTVLEPLEEGGIQVYDHQLSIPFRSQRLHVAEENEPGRACGMTCVWMALAGYGAPVIELNEIIALGKKCGGLIDGVGWNHIFLVHVIRLYGFACTRYDKKDAKVLPGDMPEVFAEHIEQGDPVLVSLRQNQGGHIVLVVGTRRDEYGNLMGFFIHDPDVFDVSRGQYQYLPRSAFIERWRQLAILPKKPEGCGAHKIISRYPTVFLK